ncbi:MAG: hypothetical protein JNM84_15650 [Planctomycetes bacterium]|nr:hypothetical protein [Planctomycetota bacterium]
MRLASSLLSAALFAAALAAPASAQRLAYAVNDDGLLNGSLALGWPVAQAAMKGVAPRALQVTAAQVITGESSGAMHLEIWTHDPALNRPGTSLGATASWNLTRVNCWQGASFAQPVALAAGQEFWLVWWTTMFCQASFSSAPANVDYCYSADGGFTWQQSAPGVNYTQACKYRLYEAGNVGTTQLYGAGKPGTGGLVPAIGVCGFPAIGNPLDVTLDLAARRAPAILLVGSQWNAPLGPAGTLLVIPVGQIPVTTGSIFSPAPLSGAATLSFAVPFDPTLRGAPVALQWWILDAGAVESLAHSDGALVTLG